MLTSKTLLNQILDENIIGAKESIHTLLAQKAKVYLEDKKRCIASITYGPCSEANGEGNCGCDEQVEEDYECNEADNLEDMNEAKYPIPKSARERHTTNDLLDAIERAYKKNGLDGYISDGHRKVLGILDPITVEEILDDAKVFFGKDIQYASEKIKGFLKPQDYAKHKIHLEEAEENKLTDKQKKLDKNHNNVLDKQDFVILRSKKKKKED